MGDEHQLLRHLGGGELGVAGVGSVDGRGGHEAGAAIDVEAALAVGLEGLLEGDVAVPGIEGQVHRSVLGVGAVLPAHLRVPVVVVGPDVVLVVARGVGGAALAARAPHLGLVRAQQIAGALVGLGVRHGPVVGVEAVVLLEQDVGGLIDTGGVLGGPADAVALGRAIGVEGCLAHGGLAHHQARSVQVPVGAAVDAASEGLHDEAMPLLRHHVQHHAPLGAGVAVPHEHLGEHEAPAAGGAARGHEGRAVVALAGLGHLVLARHEGAPGQGVGRFGQTLRQLAHVHGAVEGDDVEQIDVPALELGPGLHGAVGDALHLLQVLHVVLAEEEGVRHLSLIRPALHGISGILLDPQLGDVADHLFGHELTVLAAPGIGGALDVQEGPAAHLVAEALAGPAHGLHGDEGRDVVHLLQGDGAEGGTARGLAVAPQVQLHAVRGAGGQEQHGEALLAAARQALGGVGEGEALHGQAGPQGRGVAGQGIGLDAAGAHRGAEAVELSHFQLHRR